MLKGLPSAFTLELPRLTGKCITPHSFPALLPEQDHGVTGRAQSGQQFLLQEIIVWFTMTCFYTGPSADLVSFLPGLRLTCQPVRMPLQGMLDHCCGPSWHGWGHLLAAFMLSFPAGERCFFQSCPHGLPTLRGQAPWRSPWEVPGRRRQHCFPCISCLSHRDGPGLPPSAPLLSLPSPALACLTTCQAVLPERQTA